jgi:hypothetical protein
LIRSKTPWHYGSSEPLKDIKTINKNLLKAQAQKKKNGKSVAISEENLSPYRGKSILE